MEQPDNLPEQEPPYHDEGQVDFDLASKIKLTGHDWKQRGNMIVCASCPLRHASYIGMKWLLVGIDENGMPKFAPRK